MSTVRKWVMGAAGVLAASLAVVTGARAEAVLLAPKLPEESIDAAFAEKLARAAARADGVGFAVGVVRNGEVTLLNTYGFREAGSKNPVTADTVFRIASLSKGFASSMAALAVDEGRLSWEEPVSQHVPQFQLITPKDTERVTVETILSQRVGLPPYAFDNKLEAGVEPGEILKSYNEVKLICPVGECYTYQNTTYNMIATLLEEAEGAPYEDLVSNRIFAPLDMRTASFGREALTESGDWAKPHVRYRTNPWRIVPVEESYYNIPAAGGINASIRDMTQWLKAQMGDAPDVLPEPVLEQIHTPIVNSKAETRRWRTFRGRVQDSYYGLGWRIYDYAGHQVVSHSGGVRGYLAQIAFLPERNVGIVLLTNARDKYTGRILPTFLDMELGLRDMDWLMLDRDPD